MARVSALLVNARVVVVRDAARSAEFGMVREGALAARQPNCAMHLLLLAAQALSPTNGLLLAASISSLPSPRLPAVRQQHPRLWDRRGFVGSAAATLGLFGPATSGGVGVPAAQAFLAGKDEEVSGLVVLRVAEVCNFQEKLLRSLAACANPTKDDIKADQFGNSYCGGEAYSVNPTQIVFGTGVMLRNANLDGNLRLMIREEVAKNKKDDAVKAAVNIMSACGRVSRSLDFERALLLLCLCLIVVADCHSPPSPQTPSTGWLIPRPAIRRLRMRTIWSSPTSTRMHGSSWLASSTTCRPRRRIASTTMRRTCGSTRRRSRRRMVSSA